MHRQYLAVLFVAALFVVVLPSTVRAQESTAPETTMQAGNAATAGAEATQRSNNNNAAQRQYTSERRTVEETVIKRTIPNNGQLANTGGVPLVGLAFFALAMVGLGISVVRFAIRRER